MKHEPNATANAIAVTIGVIYVVCAAAVAFFPNTLATIIPIS